MVDAAPFRGLRYDRAVAGDPAATSAPAYDDLDALTYASHRASSPYTVLELLTPPDQTGSYAVAGAALRRWRRTGVLVRDRLPGFYRYEEHELRHGVPTVQRGLLAAVALEDGPGAQVLPHEAVDPARVADRRARLEALRADLAPVFALATDAPAELQDRLARAPEGPPVAALTDGVGVDHRVWTVTDPDEVAGLRRALHGVHVLLADGHHRYAAALAARARHPEPAWQRTLMYVVDASSDGPEVRGVHRLVRGAGAATLRRLATDFRFEPAPADPQALCRHLGHLTGRAFGLLLAPRLAAVHGASAAVLRARDDTDLTGRLPAGRSPRWRGLDTAVLDHAVLPHLAVGAPEHRADLRSAAADVAAAADALLFLVRPVHAHTAQRLAAGGELLPAKTTYFRPKPRAGLVLRPLDDEPDAAPRQHGGRVTP